MEAKNNGTKMNTDKDDPDKCLLPARSKVKDENYALLSRELDDSREIALLIIEIERHFERRTPLHFFQRLTYH